MKHTRIWALLIVALFIGMATAAQASMDNSQGSELIYKASFSTLPQTIGAQENFNNSFNNITTRGFSDLQGQLTLSLKPVATDRWNRNAVVDIYVGSADKNMSEWSLIADNFTVNHKGKYNFQISNEVLQSILEGGNGNFAFGIHGERGNVLLKSARIEISGTAVPIPGAAWLLGSGLFGLIGFRKTLRG